MRIRILTAAFSALMLTGCPRSDHFAQWNGHLPTEALHREGSGDVSLFQLKPFQQQMAAFQLPGDWHKIFQEYEFIRPIALTADHNWYVVIGRHSTQPKEDMAIILIDEIFALCFSQISTGINPGMEIKYYEQGKPFTHIHRPLSENCANNDPDLAVERLLYVQSMPMRPF